MAFWFDFPRRIWYAESPRLAASDAATSPSRPKHGSRWDRRILSPDYGSAASRASAPARIQPLAQRLVRIAAALLLTSSTAFAQTTALVGGTVIDGTGKASVPNAVVVVTRDRLTCVGTAASARCQLARRVWT